jgi:hypothetical protein
MGNKATTVEQQITLLESSRKLFDSDKEKIKKPC